jgi:protein-arginine kinase activator protein McsA
MLSVDEDDAIDMDPDLSSESAPADSWSDLDLDELHEKLNEALNIEDYITAAKIRDEIQKRK